MRMRSDGVRTRVTLVGGLTYVGGHAEPVLDLAFTHIARKKPCRNGQVPVADDADLKFAELEGVAGLCSGNR